MLSTRVSAFFLSQLVSVCELLYMWDSKIGNASSPTSCQNDSSSSLDTDDSHNSCYIKRRIHYLYIHTHNTYVCNIYILVAICWYVLIPWYKFVHTFCGLWRKLLYFIVWIPCSSEITVALSALSTLAYLYKNLYQSFPYNRY